MLYPNYYNCVNTNAITAGAHIDYAANSGTVMPNFSFPAAPCRTSMPPPSFGRWSRPPGLSTKPARSRWRIFRTAPAIPTCWARSISTPDRYYDGQDGGDNNPIYGGYDWDYNRFSLNWWTGAYMSPMQDREGWGDYSGFGSSHAGGFNAAMCDGSVRSISYSIDPNTHANLCNRQDGQVIDGSKF